MKFHPSFLFGAATSAYQVEGAVTKDGRGPSIWDTFSHTPGKIANGDTGDIACNHYHDYLDDVRHMQRLGLQSYRFSIAWPRIFPKGWGRLNERGLDFYKRLVDALADAGITPMATLYHWDLPQALQDKGGWTNRDTAEAFGEYADALFHRIGHDIPFFVTLNEPWCSTVLGHFTGVHAPGMTDIGSAVAASHHLLLAHGRALQAFRDASLSGSRIGITNIYTPVTPVTDKPQDVAAAKRMDAYLNRWFVDPLFHAKYPDELTALGIARWIRFRDMAVISAPIDFLGVNYYQRTVVQANPQDPLLGAAILPPEEPVTAMGWGIYPDGLRDVLMRLHNDYGPIPLYVTENGAAFEDTLEAGTVHDEARVSFLRRHLEAVADAIDLGVDVRGYYVWSLLDNFEWAEGYSKRFGLLYVDYATQKRYWKDSARYYQSVIASRTP